MPDIDCAPCIEPAIPNQLLWDPFPSANIPSGVFVQIPIDADDALIRHDGAAAAGRIQQDAALQRLVITEEGVYSGHCSVRINPVGAPDNAGDNPFLTEVEVRRNGVPFRRFSMRAPDGWDLNAGNVAPPNNNGIVTTGAFSGYFNPGDLFTLHFRATAFNGGSFQRLAQPQYGELELAKVGELKPVTVPTADVSCSTDRTEVTAPMQASATIRVGTSGPPAGIGVSMYSIFGDWSELIDEGGDGSGNHIGDWSANGLFALQWSTNNARDVQVIARWSAEVRYFTTPAATEPILAQETFIERQPNTSGSRRLVQRRHGGGHPITVSEGIGGQAHAIGGCFWLGPGALAPINRVISMGHGANSSSTARQYGPRAAGTLVAIEVAP